MGIIQQYTTVFFDSAKAILDSMSETDRAKVASAIVAMREGSFNLVETKVLRTPIRELKVKKYRFAFFINGQLIYFLHAFIKKSAKTPKKEIEFAEKIYKMIISK